MRLGPLIFHKETFYSDMHAKNNPCCLEMEKSSESKTQPVFAFFFPSSGCNYDFSCYELSTCTECRLTFRKENFEIITGKIVVRPSKQKRY